jgi:hypothetical protein
LLPPPIPLPGAHIRVSKSFAIPMHQMVNATKKPHRAISNRRAPFIIHCPEAEQSKSLRNGTKSG